MNALQTVFNRVEEKYLLSQNQYNKILNMLNQKIEKDEKSEYTLCNLYYDTVNNQLIRNSIEKPVYKEKIRIRSYGIPTLDTKVFLEIKKKYKGIVNKRRIGVTLKEIYDFIDKQEKPKANGQIVNEMEYFLKYYKLVPALYVAYDRSAYHGKENEEFRITFDANIRSRNYDLALEKGDYGDNLFNDNKVLMEVKAMDAMPLWFVKTLSELKIYPTSFSKYGNIYKKNLVESRRKEKCLKVF